jgi:hypothetical protein
MGDGVVRPVLWSATDLFSGRRVLSSEVEKYQRSSKMHTMHVDGPKVSHLTACRSGPTGIRNRGLAQSYAEQSKARIIPLDHRADDARSSTIIIIIPVTTCRPRQQGNQRIQSFSKIGVGKLMLKKKRHPVRIWTCHMATRLEKSRTKVTATSPSKTLGFGS